MMKQDWLIWIAAIAMIILTTGLAFSNTTNTVSSTVTGTTTVDKSPSTASAPTIINNNNDICKIGIGASVQNNVLGLASGYVVTDEFCETLRASRAMYQYGMKVAAVALLCQDARVWDSMLDAGTPCPAEGSIGAEAATYWKNNPDKIPVGSKFRDNYIAQTKPQTQEFSDADSALFFKTLFILTTGLLVF
jgi:hypothetical protein